MDIILEMAQQLADAIKTDERFLKYDEIKKQCDEDEEIQNLIKEFGLKRAAINHEMENGAPDGERFKKLNEELKDVYGKIMSNEKMAKFNEQKKEIDNLLNSINSILAAAVNGEQPSASCEGSCSSCSGCH